MGNVPSKCFSGSGIMAMTRAPSTGAHWLDTLDMDPDV